MRLPMPRQSVSRQSLRQGAKTLRYGVSTANSATLRLLLTHLHFLFLPSASVTAAPLKAVSVSAYGTDGLVCLHALTDAPAIRFAAVTTAGGKNTPLRCVNGKLRYAPFAVDTPPLLVSALSLRDSRSTKSGVRQCLRHRRACLSACAYRCPDNPFRGSHYGRGQKHSVTVCQRQTPLRSVCC